MLRHVFLVLDMSRGMDSADFKPSRREATVALAKEFVREYFDQNPISSMGVIVTRNAIAEKLSDMSGNPRRHSEAIDAGTRTISGDMTLQTALDIAVKSLMQLPSYGTREVVLVHGAHATCDPGDINVTIRELQREKVRVSVVSLPGEVYVASRIARETGGACTVPETYDDFRRALLDACRPPARRVEEGEARAHAVQMGFPTLVVQQPGLCACHCVLQPRGYLCPRCGSRLCEVPTRCTVCSLQLVSAPQLARSYHHLFSVPVFVEVPDARTPGEISVPPASAGGSGRTGGGLTNAAASAAEGDTAGIASDVDMAGSASAASASHDGAPLHVELVHDDSARCSGCSFALRRDQPRYVCPGCRGAFCADCDVLIHETLHNCPGCVG